ncbi:hypothetical protein GGI02_004907 [Coemansia sp. RSA 2322]|nr:hypothetical protein GGI02_004907 [Coemansia sp. RSA 2322]
MRPLTTSAAVADAVVDYLVIGGGVVGLAVGRRLAQRGGSTLVVEKNRRFGMETSSRNSEVIHAGIHYPRESLRTRLCIEGRERLYAYCQQQGVAHRRVGKWVVAQGDAQVARLDALLAHCGAVGVAAELIGGARVRREEPLVRADAALVSPTTGIVDSHALMAALLRDLTDAGGDFACCARVVGMQKRDAAGLYRAEVATGDAAAPVMGVRAPVVVNAAGLWADRVAAMLVPGAFRLHFARGRYYVLAPGAPRLRVRRLVYPVPAGAHAESLGTHLTLDLAGNIRFGPDVEWTDANDDYAPGPAPPPIARAARAIAAYLPAVRPEHLVLGDIGIRPKLQRPAGPFCDFAVRDEAPAGMPGFINLVGIESPGLTASLAIAAMVDQILHG